MITLDLPLEEYSELFSSALEPDSDPELEEDLELPCSCEDCKHYDDILYRCNADCCIIAAMREDYSELIGQMYMNL